MNVTQIKVQGSQESRPLVSLVLPAFNEAAIVESSLQKLCTYMAGLESEYRWEIVLVNDGSSDATGPLAQQFARNHPQVTVLHHPTNFGMGQALISGFKFCRSDYVITLDLDLSFSPDHIPAMLKAIRETRARIVVASPFAKGGRISHVPWSRKLMSVWANRFLARAANAGFSSLTGVGRAYDGKFLRSLNLRSTGMDINPEILFKAIMLRARIVEIPAHLDWQEQLAVGPARKSKMRVMRHIFSVLLSGFLFRPAHFFLLPGLALMVFALYVNVWMFIHWWDAFVKLTDYTWFLDRASVAVGTAFRAFPHTFVVGGISLLASLQLICFGVLSLQQKKYFEELFHLGTTINLRALDDDSEEP
jgi:glycosyltransferase involved in cell wall biosynthesis